MKITQYYKVRGAYFKYIFDIDLNKEVIFQYDKLADKWITCFYSFRSFQYEIGRFSDYELSPKQISEDEMNAFMMLQELNK